MLKVLKGLLAARRTSHVSKPTGNFNSLSCEPVACQLHNSVFGPESNCNFVELIGTQNRAPLCMVNH